MKKVKMLFLSAVMIAVCSSFAFKFDTGPIYVKVGSSFLLKSGQSGECVSQTSSACNYELMDGHQPTADADFIYSLSDNERWEPAP